jgi:hypothetical protein
MSDTILQDDAGHVVLVKNITVAAAADRVTNFVTDGQ